MNDPNAAVHGQVTEMAAEVYEAFFVPALFGQWPDLVLDSAGLCPGDDLLDVGCGTGILARTAARRLDESGSVTGLDCNEGMLTVARASSERVTWQQGSAEHLPFPDDSFDQTASQFALMFIADQIVGLQEMVRVTKPGGRITIATWAGLDQTPGYARMIDLVDRLFGNEAAEALSAPFALGTAQKLRSLIGEVVPNASVARHEGMARFDSLEDWVYTDVRGWTLADMITDEQYGELLDAAKRELTDFVDDCGHVSFPTPALIATADVRPADVKP